MRYSIFTLATIVLALTGFLHNDDGALYAQSNDFWVQTGTGNYQTGNNWADGSAAGVLDDAFFDTGGNPQVRWINNLGDTFSRSLTVRNGDVRFFNTAGQQLSEHRVGNNLVVESGSLEVSNHRMTIVDDFQVSNILEINLGSQISILGSFASSHVSGDNSNVTITGDGTTIDVSNTVVVGQRGNSVFTLDDNAELEVGFNFVVGSSVQGNGIGSVTIDGGAALVADNNVTVGGSGGNSIDILDGSVTSEGFIIGNNSFVSLTGETSKITSETFRIGGADISVLNVFNGSAVLTNSTTNSDVVLGDVFGSQADATINGNFSRWSTNGPIDIGVQGQGNITVENRGTFSSGAGQSRMGVGPFGDGQIAVRGVGSEFRCDELHVGVDGSDSIASGVVLEDSGKMEVNDLTISQGFVAVEGGELEAADVVADGSLFSTFDGLSTIQSLDAGESSFIAVLDESTMISLGDIAISGTLAVRNQGLLNTVNELFVSPMGRAELTGTTARIEAAEFVNEGTLFIEASNGSIQGNIDNRGEFVKTGGGGVAIFGGLVSSNSGSVEIETGNSMAVHGRLDLHHNVDGGGSTFVLNQFHPGGDEVRGVSFGGLLQLRPTSTVSLQILSSTNFDFFDASTIDLQGGELEVTFVDGFVPSVGDGFLVSLSGGLTGEFAGLPDGAIVATVGGINLIINYDNNRIRLVAVASQSTIQPESLTVFRGIASGGGLTEILDSDDQTASFLPGFTLNANEAPVWLVVEGTSPDSNPDTVSISVESQANTPGLTLSVEAFNFTSNQYDVHGQADVSFNSDATTLVSFPDVADYVDTDGTIRSRIGYRQTGFTILFPWEISVDRVSWQAD